MAGIYKRLECKCQTKLYNSFSKYGFDQHKIEVLLELPFDVSQKVLDNYEIFCINQFKVAGCVMINLKEGGSRGKCSLETRKKMSEAAKRPRRKASDTTKKKMSEAKLGVPIKNRKPLSAQHKKNMSIAAKARWEKQRIHI